MSRALFLLLLTACPDFSGVELIHTTPRADASSNLSGELTIDDNGTSSLWLLDMHALAKTELHDGTSTVVGWMLDGRDPVACTDQSVCVALSIELPVLAPLGAHACKESQIAVALHIHEALSYDYVAMAGDSCSFVLQDNGVSELAVTQLDATWSSFGHTLRATGQGRAPIR